MQSSAPSVERRRRAVSSVDLTRERLLDAAARTFSSVGIRGATTREIARKAGVNEVTLFRHFKSKEQLLRAVLERGLASEVAMMDQHSSWKENLRESMEQYARHYYSHIEKKKGMARAFLAEAQILPKSMQTMIAEVIRPVRERLVLILNGRSACGSCPKRSERGVRARCFQECAVCWDAAAGRLSPAGITPWTCTYRPWSTSLCAASKQSQPEPSERIMAQQVELAPARVGSNLHDDRGAGSPAKAVSGYSAQTHCRDTRSWPCCLPPE